MFDGNATSIIIALLAIVSTTIAAIIWVAKYAITHLSTDLKEHTKAAIAQTSSNKDLKKSINSFDTYLRERNGRDGEVHKQLIDSIKAQEDSMKALPEQMGEIVQAIADNAVNQMSSQNIMQQNVEHQHVQTEVVEHLGDKK